MFAPVLEHLIEGGVKSPPCPHPCPGGGGVGPTIHRCISPHAISDFPCHHILLRLCLLAIEGTVCIEIKGEAFRSAQIAHYKRFPLKGGLREVLLYM